MVDMTYIRDEERLKILRELALIDAPTETFYDRMTALAKDALGVEAALVSMVASEFQFFKSCVGVPEPYNSERRSHISGSFCKHVVATNEPLVVTDALADPRVADHSAIQELGMISYLGVPLTLYDGKRLGSFCVYNTTPHEWSDLEVAVVTELAAVVAYEIDMKAMVNADSTYKPRLDEAYTLLFELIDRMNANLPLPEFLAQLQRARAELEI